MLGRGGGGEDEEGMERWWREEWRGGWRGGGGWRRNGGEGMEGRMKGKRKSRK